MSAGYISVVNGNFTLQITYQYHYKQPCFASISSLYQAKMGWTTQLAMKWLTP